MPVYEYRCLCCGNHFDKRVSFAESGILPECPYCNSQDTQKELSLSATIGLSSASGSSCAPSSSPFS